MVAVCVAVKVGVCVRVSVELKLGVELRVSVLVAVSVAWLVIVIRSGHGLMLGQVCARRYTKGSQLERR